jgi:hypothetical protein
MRAGIAHEQISDGTKSGGIFPAGRRKSLPAGCSDPDFESAVAGSFLSSSAAAPPARPVGKAVPPSQRLRRSITFDCEVATKGDSGGEAGVTAVKCILAMVGVFLVQAAHAYEYKLQYTPNGGARGLVVAGYTFSGDTVLGNCSYYTEHSGSGRGGGYHTSTTYYYQTCTWDLYGNLLSVAQGAPAVPTPVSVAGTKTVYASNAAGGSTGSDTALGGGFVTTIGAHYSWATPETHTDLQDQKYFFIIKLVSDGDVPLTISAVDVGANLARTGLVYDHCVTTIGPGHFCTVTVLYDPTRLSSPTGLAYDTLTVAVTSNAGQATDFVQSFTDSVKLPVDDGGG